MMVEVRLQPTGRDKMELMLSRGYNYDLACRAVEKYKTAHCCGKNFPLRKEWIIIFRGKIRALCPSCNKFIELE